MLTPPHPPPPPLQKQLASIMISLGCVSSALLIYEQLELWEDAVVCLERLGQHGKVSLHTELWLRLPAAHALVVITLFLPAHHCVK